MSQETEPRNVDSWSEVPRNRHNHQAACEAWVAARNKELAEAEGAAYRQICASKVPSCAWVRTEVPNLFVSVRGQYVSSPYASYGKRSIIAKADEKDATDLQPPKPTGQTRRKEVLREVEKCVCRDRQAAYADAEDNFKDIAAIASIVLSPKLKEPLSAADVASFCAAIKLARLRTSPGHMDNWIDLAGYAVCGGGIVLAERRDSTPNNEGGKS